MLAIIVAPDGSIPSLMYRGLRTLVWIKTPMRKHARNERIWLLVASVTSPGTLMPGSRNVRGRFRHRCSGPQLEKPLRGERIGQLLHLWNRQRACWTRLLSRIRSSRNPSAARRGHSRNSTSRGSTMCRRQRNGRRSVRVPSAKTSLVGNQPSHRQSLIPVAQTVELLGFVRTCPKASAVRYLDCGGNGISCPNDRESSQSLIPPGPRHYAGTPACQRWRQLIG